MPIRISKNRVALEGIPINLSAEVTVPSAATTAIGAVTVLSNNILISGTTPITSFGTADAGIDRYLRFATGLTLTNNLNIILPGGASITTAQNDTAHFVSRGGGVWFCRNYARASGHAVAVVLVVDLTAQVNIWSKGQRGVFSPLTVTTVTNGITTIVINLADSNNYSVTLDGDRVLGNPTNMVAGQSGIIAVTQDGTGSKAMTYGTNYRFANGVVPILTTTGGRTDHLAYYVETTSRIFISITKNIN